VIVNAEGLPIRPPRGRAVEGSSADQSQKYAANLSSLAAKARSVVRDLDPTVCSSYIPLVNRSVVVPMELIDCFSNDNRMI
jgi:hypothetical protein